MDQPGFPRQSESDSAREEERMRLQAEIERFEGRKLPGWLVATLVLFLIITVLGLLLWPLMSEAHRWKSGPLGATTPSPAQEIDVAIASRSDVDDSLLTPAQARVAKQRVVVMTRTDPRVTGYTNSRATGFVLDDGLVITAAHVVTGAIAETTVVACGNRQVPAETLRMDDTLDIALLSAPGCNGERLALDPIPPNQDEWVAAVGYRFWSKGDDLTGLPESQQEEIRQLPDHNVMGLPYAHFRRVDTERMLSIADMSTCADRTAPNCIANAKATQRVALISHKGLPRPIAVKGLALPGESGSLLVRSNGNIVGLYVMSFLSFNRTYFMPASAIRLVLRGYETKG